MTTIGAMEQEDPDPVLNVHDDGPAEHGDGSKDCGGGGDKSRYLEFSNVQKLYETELLIDHTHNPKAPVDENAPLNIAIEKSQDSVNIPIATGNHPKKGLELEDSDFPFMISAGLKPGGLDFVERSIQHIIEQNLDHKILTNGLVLELFSLVEPTKLRGSISSGKISSSLLISIFWNT